MLIKTVGLESSTTTLGSSSFLTGISKLIFSKVLPFNVLSTTINDQVYLSIEQMKSKWGNDFDYYYNRVKSAVDATKGQVITYD